MKTSAIISNCGQYRYRLERGLGNGPTIVGVMINPSWADSVYNDRTIARWIGFGVRNGWGKIIIGNKFAFRSQKPREMASCVDPVGPENDAHLSQMIAEADLCIAAWGPIAKISMRAFRDRWKVINEMASNNKKQLYCWGVASDGHPLHPLMLPYSSVLSPWKPPAS